MKPHTTLLATTNSSEAEHRKILVDFIISHADGDKKPYLKISILGYSCLGLLDSGSSSTLVSKEGCDILLGLGLVLDSSRQPVCKVANGNVCTTIGTIKAHVQLLNKIYVLDILVVPNLSSKLILGMDFWVGMDVIPDLWPVA